MKWCYLTGREKGDAQLDTFYVNERYNVKLYFCQMMDGKPED